MGIHRRLYALATKKRLYLPRLAIFSLLLSGVVIFQMHLLAKAIDSVFIGSEPLNPILLFMLGAIIIVRALLLWWREREAQINAIKIKSALRLKLIDKLLEKGPAFARSEKTGELVAVATEGIEKLDDYYTRYIPSIVHLFILPLTIIGFVFFIDWPSGLIMLITGPLIVFFMWLIGTYAKIITQKQWGEISAMSAHFLDALQGLKTLKVFGAQEREAGLVTQTSNNFRLITMQVLKIAFLSGLVLELAASISIALVALQIGIRLIEGMMVFNLGLFVLLLAPEFYIPFRMLGMHHHAGMEGAAAAEKIFDTIDSGSIHEIWEEAPLNGIKPPKVVFSNVAYIYPGVEQSAINHINATLEAGSITALVGPTGSGKSTFVHLLLGFLRPTSGQILINGKNLFEYKKKHWQQMVAFVPQHPHFFNTTILDNLLMANSAASHTDVEAAIAKSGLLPLISTMPLGLDTQLTDNASRLSSGEKQRLALARAFLKDAPLLILDEPTSGLDPESEQAIAGALVQLAKNRTTVIIAHRLNTVKRANKIIVFEKGIITQTGSHELLLKQSGVYAGFFETLRKNNSIID